MSGANLGIRLNGFVSMCYVPYSLVCFSQARSLPRSGGFDEKDKTFAPAVENPM